MAWVVSAAVTLVSEYIAAEIAFGVLEAGLFVGSELAVGSVVGGAAGLVAGKTVLGVVNGAMGGGDNSVSAGVAQGVLLNSASTVEPLPVIYGTRKVGGTRCLIGVSGANNEHLHLVIALGEGEIAAVDAIYLDDVNINDPRFAGLVSSEIYLGTDSQSASAALIEALPGQWSDQHVGQSVAYLVLHLTYSQSAFGGLPTVTADVRGRKVFDPRTGIAAYSNNPALCIRDYLTHSRYGRGISADLIDDESFIAAANHCEEIVSIPDGSQMRYSCDGLVNIDNTALDNLKSLLTSCRGMLVYSGGRYKLVIDRRWSQDCFAFTEDNITGSWTISQPGRRAKYNRVTAGIFNPDNHWQPDFAIADSTAYRAQDNGLLLETRLDLPFTANRVRGQQLAGLVLKQSRFGLSVRFSALAEGLRAEVGDVVSISHSTPGWNAKKFRVLQIDLKSDDEVDISAAEYDDTVYVLDTLTLITGTSSTSLPNPFALLPPTDLVLTSGTNELLVQADGTVVSRIKVTWRAPADVFVSTAEIQIKPVDSSVWQTAVSTLASSGAAWLSAVNDGLRYDVRLRFYNAFGVVSSWCQAAPHAVVGKTAPPSNVPWLRLDGTRLTWGGVADMDLAGYRVRWQPGVSRSWSDALELHTGYLSVSPWDLATIPYGAGQILIKAVDTTGNESVAVTAVSCNLGDAPVQNVFASYPLNSTPVLAIDASRMWGNPASQLWTDDAAVFLLPQYQPIQWSGSTVFTDSGHLTLSVSVIGYAWKITWKKSTDAAYVPFPGRAWVDAGLSYEFRIDVEQSATQGSVGMVEALLDVPDKTIRLPNIGIAAGGSRLAIGAGWRSVVIVNLTLQGDGGSATTARVLDKSTTGPLVQCFNASGAATAATVDAYVQGY
ncbi:MAG: phage tail protein [Burkholderiaceae bacterium]